MTSTRILVMAAVVIILAAGLFLARQREARQQYIHPAELAEPISVSPTEIQAMAGIIDTLEGPRLYLNIAGVKDLRDNLAGGSAWSDEARAAAVADAEEALMEKTFSVTTDGGPDGGHTYQTERPYAGWKKVDGKDPDVRDGQINPRADRSDYTALLACGKNTRDLALAWVVTGDERYAARAAFLLDTWCLDPGTAMTPAFSGGTSRIELSVAAPTLFYGMDLLRDWNGWVPGQWEGLQAWASDLGHSALEWRRSNNIEAWRINLLAVCGAAADEPELLATAWAGHRAYIDLHLGDDGLMSAELRRTNSYSYSLFGLNALSQTALIARNFGVSLGPDSSPRFQAALLQHAGFYPDLKGWPGKQNEAVNASGLGFFQPLAIAWPDSARDLILEKLGARATESRIMGPVWYTHATSARR